MKLEISKIRGETSYGMLCSESELNLSSESEGIIELNQKYKSKIKKTGIILSTVKKNYPTKTKIFRIKRHLKQNP